MLEFLTPDLLQGQDVYQGFLGALIGIGASIFGGLSKKKAAKAEAEATARSYELNAEQVRDRAKVEETLRVRAGIREEGTISAAAGANNLAGGGSAADILRESRRNRIYDVNSIRRQSELQAQSLEASAEGARKGGKARGRAALAEGAFSAASFLL